jgi:hypothetical protein
LPPTLSFHCISLTGEPPSVCVPICPGYWHISQHVLS